MAGYSGSVTYSLSGDTFADGSAATGTFTVIYTNGTITSTVSANITVTFGNSSIETSPLIITNIVLSPHTNQVIVGNGTGFNGSSYNGNVSLPLTLPANLQTEPTPGSSSTLIGGTGNSGNYTSFHYPITGNAAFFTTLPNAGGVGNNNDLTVTAVCFFAGTHIRTVAGDVLVEDLKAGDMLVTASGAIKPVRWLGRSTMATRFADRLRFAPIRIKAGALADNVPTRDLLVSPAHAMFIGGVLIQAAALVNGTSIVQETNLPETFVYYHVELATHEILISEGAASESFIDNVDRINFDNWAEHEALGLVEPIAEMDLPRAKAHRQVPAGIRASIATRAARFAPDTIAA